LFYDDKKLGVLVFAQVKKLFFVLWLCQMKALGILKIQAARAGKTLGLLLALIFYSTNVLHATELRLLIAHWPPNNFLDEKGEPTGLSVTVVEAIKDRLGIDTAIELVPWARGYEIAKTKPNVFLFAAGKNDERLKMGFKFIGPVTTANNILVAKKGSHHSFESLEDARDSKISVAGVRGSWQAKMLKSTGIDVVETDNHTMAARMLMADRIDAWIISTFQAGHILTELGFPVDATETIYTISQSQGHIMVSKGTDPETIKKWKQAFDEVARSDLIKEAARNWSRKLGTNLTFDPKSGFIAEKDKLQDGGS
jgi:polar amino acid transport system substrate-binding protein